MFLIIAIMFAALTAFIADKNNRNSGVAALLGLFFGVFALIGYVIAGKKSNS